MPREEKRVVMPSFDTHRALAAFKRQQAELETFRGRGYRDAADDEKAWLNLTQSLVERTFGNPSSNMDKYYSASTVGYHNVMGIDESQRQQNFEQRQRAFGSLLKSTIAELELDLPEADVKGVYAPGDDYDLYRDLSDIIAKAQQRVFIVDAYVDEQLFNLYVSKARSATVAILTNRIGTNVEIVSKKYASSRPLSLRTSGAFHDRLIFVDDRGWVLGQSVKDAATKKPTYLIELEEPALSALRDLHDKILQSATVIV